MSEDLSSSEIQLRSLMQKKDEIEKEINECNEVLRSNKDVQMTESLKDAEDFPRSDIDVHSVTIARKRIICLNTDHMELMKKIQLLLEKVHEETRDNPRKGIPKDKATSDVHPVTPNTNSRPFARIDELTSDSIALKSGLQIDDLIIKFGSIDVNSFNDLKDIAEEYKKCKQNEKIEIFVKRNDKVNRVEIVKPEPGQNLGFHMSPYKC